MTLTSGFLFTILLLLHIPKSSSSVACNTMAFSKNVKLFTSYTDLPHLSASLHWNYHSANSTLSVAFTAPPARPGGWVAWGLNPSVSGRMLGSQAVAAYRQSDGSLAAKTFNVSSYAGVAPSPIAFETWGLEAEEEEDSGGGCMRIFATMRLPHGVTTMSQVWQVGPSSKGSVLDAHEMKMENMNSFGTLDMIHGRQNSGVLKSAMKEKNMHGILNAVNWGILLPTGVIFARYLKVFRSLNRAWFYLHITCQLIGYGLGVTGWGTGLNLGSKSQGIQFTTHRNIGIALFSLATLQVNSLFLRPRKDHKYRKYWHWYHFTAGAAIILMGVLNVFQGLSILNPDKKWNNAYIGVISVLMITSLVLEATTFFIAEQRRKHELRKNQNTSDAANELR